MVYFTLSSSFLMFPFMYDSDSITYNDLFIYSRLKFC